MFTLRHPHVPAQASAELGTQWSDVIAQQDVATYGGLCALATLSRPELRSRVIDNIQFREFLEVVPEVRACASASQTLFIRVVGATSG